MIIGRYRHRGGCSLARAPGGRVGRGGWLSGGMCAELRHDGLHGLSLPEEHGGQGFSVDELAVVLEEMGRVLLCAPFLSTVCLAAPAILHAGTDAQRRAFLPGIASGAVTATLDARSSSQSTARAGSGRLLLCRSTIRCCSSFSACATNPTAS